jgi:hypothetical protein
LEGGGGGWRVEGGGWTIVNLPGAFAAAAVRDRLTMLK